MNLEERVEELSKRVDALSEQLKLTYSYARLDAEASLGKCRILLEQLVTAIMQKHGLQYDPAQNLHKNIVRLKEQGVVEERIISKMLSIKSMANLAVHGEKVLANDALNALDNLCDIIQWHHGIVSELHVAKSNWLMKWWWVGGTAAIILAFVAFHFLKRQETITYEQVIQFAKEYQSTSNGNDVDAILSFYADTVVHYGEIKNKEAIRQGQIKYIDRWYERNFFISSPVDCYKTANGQFMVSYEIRFNAISEDRKKTSKGVWRDRLVIAKRKNGLRIVAIDGEIVRRD